MVTPMFKIVYTKKNGEERTIRCQVDPEYHTHRSNKPEYVVVFDLDKQGYRTVNTSTIKLFEALM